MKKRSPLVWLKRVVQTLLVLEIIYLLVFNIVLNLSFTQTQINKLDPEKFHISWDNAWTPYPLRLEVSNLSASGEDDIEKWQIDISKASVSMALLPLLNQKVKIHNVSVGDINYVQHLKIKSAQNNTPIDSAQPSAEERETEEDTETWYIDIDTIVAEGQYTFLVDDLKGDFSGKVETGISVDTNGGPFTLTKGKLDIDLNSLLINSDQMVLKESKINGNIKIDPVIFSEQEGNDVLKFITFDIDIKAQMGNLDFLDIYLNTIQGMQLDGKGLLAAHIDFDKGTLREGTAIKVDANELSVTMLDHEVQGNGHIDLNVTDANPDVVAVQILFDDLEASYVKSDKALFIGKNLLVESKGAASIFPEASNNKKINYLNIEIPSVKVEDLGQFQRYIPELWRFKLYEGEGELQFHTKLSQKHLKSRLKLSSEDAHVGVSQSHFKSDLDLVLNLDVDVSSSFEANVSGSYLALTNSKLFNQKKSDKRASKDWDTKLNIRKGTLNMPLPAWIKDANSTENLSTEEKVDILKGLMTKADANLEIFGSVSQFDWINLLLKNSLNLSFWGHGEIEGQVELEKGLLVKGAALKVNSKDLEVHVLDYNFKGDGAFSFELTKGGENPDVTFDLGLNNAQMKRLHEKQAMIDKVVLKLNGIGKNLGSEGAGKDVELRLQIPSAKVEKVSLYNQFFPKESPFKFINGSAGLEADILLKSNDAKGYVRFKTDGLTMKVDEQKVSARLDANVKIAGGVPRNMDFDISGSTIVLDQAKILGTQTSYTQKDWSASVTLKKAHAIWKQPVKLELETTLKIKDTRPIVAMINNKKKKTGILSKILTLEDIGGTAKMTMGNNVIRIPSALLKSDKIDIGAKGIISPKLREGMFYLRFHKLKGLLKLRDGEKNYDIFGVQDTYDNYVVPR